MLPRYWIPNFLVKFKKKDQQGIILTYRKDLFNKAKSGYGLLEKGFDECQLC